MLPQLTRYPRLTWALAWGLTAGGLFLADVFSTPRRGPLWVGLLAGVLAWGIAGALTFRAHGRRVRGVIWALAYTLAFWLGATWGSWFEHNQVGSIQGAGFMGALLGWTAGAAAGAFATALLVPARLRVVRAFVFASAWGLSFLIAAFLAIVGGMILGELAKVVLAFLGSQALALWFGWSVGGAIAGLLAAAAGFGAWRLLYRRVEAAEAGFSESA